MKTFVALSALLAIASANPLYIVQAPVITPAPASVPLHLLSTPLIVPSPVSSQYHAQDAIGQYVYGYNDHLSSKQEIKSLNGVTQGFYSYIDSNNILQTAQYTADADGFRVIASNLPKPVELPVVVPVQDLPKQVDDTYEVALAKSAHLAAIEEAKKQSDPLPISEVLLVESPIELPRPVEDTPEVAAAKALHLVALEEAKKKEVFVFPIPVELPRPVEDTPEVAKAKKEHLIAVEQAKL